MSALDDAIAQVAAAARQYRPVTEGARWHLRFPNRIGDFLSRVGVRSEGDAAIDALGRRIRSAPRIYGHRDIAVRQLYVALRYLRLCERAASRIAA